MSERKFTLRLYEPALIDELNNFRERQHFPDENKLLTYIIRVGIEALTCSESKNHVLHKEQCESSAEYIETIKTLIVALRELQNSQSVTERLLSSLYALCMAQNENRRLLPSKVESGFYDSLPARFGDTI